MNSSNRTIVIRLLGHAEVPSSLSSVSNTSSAVSSSMAAISSFSVVISQTYIDNLSSDTLLVRIYMVYHIALYLLYETCQIIILIR